MNTRYFTITDPARESAAVEQAADIRRRGGLLAIPTETGYGLGADDYVVKPFSPRELMMRVGAVLRRAQASSHAEYAHETVSIENMLVDFTARQVTIDGAEVDLSPKEYDLLFFMVRNRGIALTRDRLISEGWGYDFFGDVRTLDTHI